MQNMRMIVVITSLVALGGLGFFYYRYHTGKKCVPTSIAPKTILAFLGAPGSGKGTLAKKAVNSLGFISLSTGDLCRAEVASGSEKGKMIAQYMQGGLIPDEVMTDMVDSWLGKNAGKKPIIVDGYPRTKEQAEKLNELLQQKFPDYNFSVIYLHISDEDEVVERIANRLVCEKCKGVCSRKDLENTEICPKCGGKLTQRDDDKEEIVRERLKTFNKNNKKIMSYYKKIDIPVQKITVSHRTPEEIFQDFKQLLNDSSGKKGYLPGEICPVSGTYRLRHPEGVSGEQAVIPLSKGERFPPCRTCPEKIEWVLEKEAKLVE